MNASTNLPALVPFCAMAGTHALAEGENRFMLTIAAAAREFNFCFGQRNRRAVQPWYYGTPTAIKHTCGVFLGRRRLPLNTQHVGSSVSSSPLCLLSLSQQGDCLLPSVCPQHALRMPSACPPYGLHRSTTDCGVTGYSMMKGLVGRPPNFQLRAWHSGVKLFTEWFILIKGRVYHVDTYSPDLLDPVNGSFDLISTVTCQQTWTAAQQV